MFAALSVLALASSVEGKFNFKDTVRNAHKQIRKNAKANMHNEAVKQAKNHRKLAETMKEEKDINRRQLRFSEDYKRSGFYLLEMYDGDQCTGNNFMELSVPIKKEMGCESDDGNSMMFTSCHVDANTNEIKFDFDWYETPACNGMSPASNSFTWDFGNGPIHNGDCVHEFGQNFKIYCHEGVGNAIFAKAGVLMKEFDKTVECRDNVDPLDFALIKNGACLPRMFFDEGGENDGPPEDIQSISSYCKNGMRFYEGFDDMHCMGNFIDDHQERIRTGCRNGYEMEKCVDAGYLVRSQYYKGELNTQKAMALEKCVMSSPTTSMMNGNFGKNGTHFKYEVAEFDNNMCNGTPVNTWWEAVPYEAQDDDMLEGTHYMNRYWYAHTLKEALDLNLLKVWGNDAWNDWWTWELYPNDQCMGEPHSTIAGKQLCNGGFTDRCWDDRMESQRYNDFACNSPDGSPMVIHRDECKMIDDGIYAKANCYFKGQNYWKPMEHHMTGMH
eukprot:TRINITY_DN62669_c0_g1_i1.p1 TRINITY_DN62669_c0_g1~~TRINITY_DN62669_c0_g1_i1.p1  ORF type:complete len:499 (+),score=34.24 TRINITY_DN62669_c0_g1_i1:52-1548(+)